MSEMNFSSLTKVELDNASDVILMLYKWDREAKEKEFFINSPVTKDGTCLESIPDKDE